MVERFLAGMILLGVALMVTGAGLFIYVIFFRNGYIEDGGIRVASATAAEGKRHIALDLAPGPVAELGQLRVTFGYETQFYTQTPQEVAGTIVRFNTPNFHLWNDLSVTDDHGHRIYHDSIAFTWDNTTSGTNQPFVAPLDQSVASGTNIYHSPAFAIPANTPLHAAFHWPDLPTAELGDSIDAPRKNRGKISSAEMAFYRGVVDVRAYHEFNATAPTWGIWGGLAGLVLVVLAISVFAALPRETVR